MSVQQKIENLRRIREERERLAQQISDMKESMAPHSALNYSRVSKPRINSWDRHQLSMSADSQRVAEWVQNDFEEFHRDEIEKKLRTSRARVLINGIMEEADQAYNSKVIELGVDNLESLHEAEQFISTRDTTNNNQKSTRKRIIINQSQNANYPSAQDEESDSHSQAGSQSSRALSLLNDEEKREIISQFIDEAYGKIIKIIKVYIIRAMYFEYGIPNQTQIVELKDRLLGHMHIPKKKWPRLLVKSRIEYLNISPGSQKVELVSAWVMRVNPGHLYITHNTTGVGKGVKVKWRRLNHHFPIFHKITNDDINIECGFNQHTQSDQETDIDDLSSIQSEPLYDEYTSNDEYESD